MISFIPDGDIFSIKQVNNLFAKEFRRRWWQGMCHEETTTAAKYVI